MRNLYLIVAAGAMLPTLPALAQQSGSATSPSTSDRVDYPRTGAAEHAKMSQQERARAGQIGARGMGQMDHSQMGHMDPSKMRVTAANPYPPVEMRMHQQMMSAIGSDAAETWVRKMIEHHRGAIEMSKLLASKGGDKEALAKAQKMSAMQEKEIAELQSWLRQHGKKPQ